MALDGADGDRESLCDLLVGQAGRDEVGNLSFARCQRQRAGGAPAQAADAVTRSFVGQTVAAMEKTLILDTLTHCLGNRTHAANILGISIRTLRNKLNEYADEGAAIPAPQSGVSAGVPGYAA